jgi:uncharacterized protein YpmS
VSLKKRAFFVLLAFPVVIFLGVLGWTLVYVSEPNPTRKTSAKKPDAGVTVLPAEFQAENVTQSL